MLNCKGLEEKYRYRNKAIYVYIFFSKINEISTKYLKKIAGHTLNQIMITSFNTFKHAIRYILLIKEKID